MQKLIKIKYQISACNLGIKVKEIKIKMYNLLYLFIGSLLKYFKKYNSKFHLSRVSFSIILTPYLHIHFKILK